MTRLKLAELTSGIGALMLGVGLGGLFPRWFGPAAGWITIAATSFMAHLPSHRVRASAVDPIPMRLGRPVGVEVISCFR